MLLEQLAKDHPDTAHDRKSGIVMGFVVGHKITGRVRFLCNDDELETIFGQCSYEQGIHLEKQVFQGFRAGQALKTAKRASTKKSKAAKPSTAAVNSGPTKKDALMTFRRYLSKAHTPTKTKLQSAIGAERLPLVSDQIAYSHVVVSEDE